MKQRTIFFFTEALEDDGGDAGAAGEAEIEAIIAGPLDLTGDVEACRWVCSLPTPPPLETQHSCDLLVDAAKEDETKTH